MIRSVFTKPTCVAALCLANCAPSSAPPRATGAAEQRPPASSADARSIDASPGAGTNGVVGPAPTSGEGDAPLDDGSPVADRFQVAVTAFRRRAANALSVAENDVSVTPSSERVRGIDQQGIGPFVAFQGSARGRTVSGWATLRGEVVLGTDSDLSPLVRAADLVGTRALSLDDFAARLAWGSAALRVVQTEGYLHGMDAPDDFVPPELVRARDGSASFRFFVLVVEKPGFALFEHVIDISRDGRAIRAVRRRQ
jgi:hypothetical protein